MKSYEILGYAFDGALYCTDHAPQESADNPVFMGDVQPTDHCDECLARWIAETPANERDHGAPGWVFLFGEVPKRTHAPEYDEDDSKQV